VSKTPPPPPVELFVDLRRKALAYSGKQGSVTHGLIADIAYDEGVVTIVCLDDDTTSMYTSHGGGIIGAGEHEAVQSVTRRVVELAALQAEQLPRSTSDDLPPPGTVQFFILAPDGLRSESADEELLDSRTHQLSPLFFAIQDVVTQLSRVDPAL
jgi:hypothetical protein